MFTHNRPHHALNGMWKFCPDPMQRCRRQQWWKHAAKPNDLFPCWDPAGLWEIQVPGTWKTQFDELRWYDGHAVYLLDFTLAETPEDCEAYLVFDGVVYSADVYLNGHCVGQHQWGYSPFSYRVTEMLQRENRLFVLVENLLQANRVPGEIFDWNNDGGIINPVKLVFVPRIFVENFRTATHLDGDEVVIDIEVMLQSRNAEARETVSVSIPELELSASTAVTPGQTGQVSFRIPREHITLWSPETPQLYRTELATRWETIADDIGYREIRTEDGQILLNGAPLRLYGVSVHAEFPGTGRTATPQGMALLLARAKELGVNFLRCAHYPYAESFGRALDQAGLLWWEEVPAYWLRNMDQPEQTQRACGMLRETILRDWNRASLIIWSVSNECCYRNPADLNDNNYPYWFTAVPMVRTLDPTRLISCAEAGNFVSVRPVWNPAQADEFDRRVSEVECWRLGHSDDWYNLFDILAGNVYVGSGEAATAYRRFVELLKPFHKPLMLSEFGSMSLLGADLPPDRLGSEARHGTIIKEAYASFAELPEIVAYSPWCLMDIRVPLHWRWYNQGKAVFRYGFCDEHGDKKTVFATLQACIARLKERMRA